MKTNVNPYVKWARNRVERNRSALIVINGATGCLSEDTKVYGQSQSIGELYKSNKKHIDTYSFSKNFYVKSKSEIIDSGLKEVYEIELENGKKVLATKDHIFFKKLDRSVIEDTVQNLKIGDALRQTDVLKIEKNYEKLRRASLKRTEEDHKNFTHQRSCICCKSPYYVNIGVGRSSHKRCKTCREVVNETKHKKYKSPCTGKLIKVRWTLWQDQILKNFYEIKEKIFLMNLVGNKSWNAIKHRALRLGMKRDPKFQTEKFILNNYINNPSKRADVKKQKSIYMKKYYKDNPEKHPNRVLKRNRMTSIEIIMKTFLDEQQVEYKYNSCIKTVKGYKFPDFRIGKLIIECDSQYFHSDKIKETNRDRELINSGYSILHFSDKKIMNNFQVVERCVMKRLRELGVV